MKLLELLEMRRLLSTSVSGTFTVDAATSHFTLINGVVVDRTNLASSVRITRSGTLLIEGTTTRDDIKVLSAVSQTPTLIPVTSKSLPVFSISFNGASAIFDGTSNQIIVQRNFNGQTIFQNFSKKDVKRIQVEAGAGNDTVSVGAGVGKTALIVGGKGNDTLVGGALGDTISGGDGDDVISAAPAILVVGDPPAQGVGARVETNTAIKTRSGIGDQLQFIGADGVTNTVIGGGITGNTTQTSTVFENDDSADLLEGGSGDDIITAGNGPDTINGGGGTDTLRTINRGQPERDLLTTGSDPRDFDGLTLFSIESISAN